MGRGKKEGKKDAQKVLRKSANTVNQDGRVQIRKPPWLTLPIHRPLSSQRETEGNRQEAADGHSSVQFSGMQGPPHFFEKRCKNRGGGGEQMEIPHVRSCQFWEVLRQLRRDLSSHILGCKILTAPPIIA